MKSKIELRKEILQRRDALSLEERIEKSHQIAEKVIAQKEFIEADKILLFASYKSEVNTEAIFVKAKALGKEIYYPKVIGKEMEFFKMESETDLKEGYRGIPEPEENAEKQFRPVMRDRICVIMPGAVFDAEGNRIGYGGGYYDKYLQQLEAIWENDKTMLKKHIYKLALAFQFQIVESGKILREQYDIKVDSVITEDQIIDIYKGIC